MNLRRSLPRLLTFGTIVAGIVAAPCQAQSFRRGGTEFNALREVEIPEDESYSIVVTEFFHHGEINDDGTNLGVFRDNRRAVPHRILQLGPGDFCRLAFQTEGDRQEYEILYGGEPPAPGEIPEWTSRAGLLLETREFVDCDPSSLESVRKAFESAEPIGADYVDGVAHSHNPFSLKPEPFLSRYSGTLRVPSNGTYGFLVTSQDCSFLLIDGKEVVSAPGVHRPQSRAKPGMRKDIQLKAGGHKFEYYHAATTPKAMMVAAWEIAPKEAKPKPTAIPPEAFRAGTIGRSIAKPVQMREERMVPDFLVKIAGDVPLPTEEPADPSGGGWGEQPGGPALIGVKFKDTSPQGLSLNADYEWHFGDGQTSDLANPEHVYLKPGVYEVTLRLKRRTRVSEMSNRIRVDRPMLTRKDKDNFHELDNYLPILDGYDPRKLDGQSLYCLVEAFLWKADLTLNPKPVEEDKKKDDKKDKQGEGAEQAETPEEKTPEQLAEEQRAREAEAATYVRKAVDMGKWAFAKDSVVQGQQELHDLIDLLGPLTRDRVGDSKLAYQMYKAAAGKLENPKSQAQCEMNAADILINDMVNAEAAKPLLDSATSKLGEGQPGKYASRLARIWGDYYAATGDGAAARKAYRKAEQVRDSMRTHAERMAWRGAHSRSAEKFLMSEHWGRARSQIRAWQNQFPLEKIDGYVSLIYARYFAGREMYEQAVAQAEQALNVNPNSAYIDRLLLVAAECEVKRGKVDRALATLHSLVNDYPGSPLVPEVKARIAELESGDTEEQ